MNRAQEIAESLMQQSSVASGQPSVTEVGGGKAATGLKTAATGENAGIQPKNEVKKVPSTEKSPSDKSIIEGQQEANGQPSSTTRSAGTSDTEALEGKPSADVGGAAVARLSVAGE